MTEIVMPKLSDTMTEGIIGTWLKSVGDRVNKGDSIAEIETDKATMQLEAFASGVLLEQRAEAGQTIAVGMVIGIIGEENETHAVKGIRPAPGPYPELSAAIPDTVPENTSAAGYALPRSREKTAPAVRRRAHELGVDLDSVRGSGPGGRILLLDLEQFVPKGSSADDRHAAEQPVNPGASEKQNSNGTDISSQTDEVLPMSRMRDAIAQTVSKSWQTIPHFSETVEIRMDKAEELRRELRSTTIRVSLNDIIIKAASVALQKYLLVNASLFEGRDIIIHRDINIGIMVSVQNGLLVPVIKRCQSLSIKEIANNSRQLIESARNGTVSESDISGGTFSISNLGMYGICQFTAVILPPQVAILAVGAVIEKVIAHKEHTFVARIMKTTLSADHRVLDGAYVAEFLKELKHILEHPLQLLF